MNQRSLNFSTGPVNISEEVRLALTGAPVSHRSQEFRKLYDNTASALCKHFNVKHSFFITGSGTAANEAMIWQIKMQGGKGLILSNGEFGARLISQAQRISLDFIEYNLAWGSIFDKEAIETAIVSEKICWVLFCHCETSTGMLNDLDLISGICSRHNCRCFVDCMSTVGTYAFSLGNVTMATASSGKGLASLPGIGLVFSNLDLISSKAIPFYFDLGYYSDMEGTPFTMSSNLLRALNVSVKQKLQTGHYRLIENYSHKCFKMLNEAGLLPFSNLHSKVFTIAANDRMPDFVKKLREAGVVLSFESGYLKKRNFCQLAFLGLYNEQDLEDLLNILKTVLRLNVA